jgi:6-pyruvoyltetrahydropterin/6-carboxytetrahydropterin synthase
MKITKRFMFEAAHNLINYKGKCERLHGHGYELEITLEGDVKPSGMVIDFGDIKKIVTEKILDRLDHYYINDIISQPSAENIAIWIFNELKNSFDGAVLVNVKLYEGPNSYVEYDGE